MAVDLSGSSSAASSSTSIFAANTSVKDTSINVSASDSVQEDSIVIPVPSPPPPVNVPKAIPKVKKAPVPPVGEGVQTRSQLQATVSAVDGAASGSGIFM